MSRSLLLLGLILTITLCQGQLPASSRTREYLIAFYNTENLFDTTDDPKKNDNEFLPGSDLKWDQQKYNRKLENTARVLASMDSTCRLALVGLAEVENIKVLRDLLTYLPRRGKDTGMILEEGNDPRGIDVAIVYDRNLLTLIKQKPFQAGLGNQSRYILYCKFLTVSRDTLHVLVNHWKSRAGGEKETANSRMTSAKRLKNICDSLFVSDMQARIIILGDFNDNPTDPSLTAGLGTFPVEGIAHPSSLYNLMLRQYKDGEGSLYYRGWEMFDQIIVSGSLIMEEQRGARINPPSGMVYRKEWMMLKNNQGIMIPNRTAGKHYLGGYSDHLPVYVKINY